MNLNRNVIHYLIRKKRKLLIKKQIYSNLNKINLRFICPSDTNKVLKLIRNKYLAKVVDKILLYHRINIYKDILLPYELTYNFIQKVISNVFHKYHLKYVFDQKKLDTYFDKYYLNCLYKKTSFKDENIEEIKKLTKLSTYDLIKTGLIYDEKGKPVYGINQNTLVFISKKNKLKTFQLWRHIHAAIQGEKLYLDFSPSVLLNNLQRDKCSNLVYNSFLKNYVARIPFSITFAYYNHEKFSSLTKIIENRSSKYSHFLNLTNKQIPLNSSRNLFYIYNEANEVLNLNLDCDYIFPVCYNLTYNQNYKLRNFISSTLNSNSKIRLVRLPIPDKLNEKFNLFDVISFLIYLKNGFTLDESLKKVLKNIHFTTYK